MSITSGCEETDDLKRERRLRLRAEAKLADALRVSESELKRIVAHTERFQHLRFAQIGGEALAPARVSISADQLETVILERDVLQSDCSELMSERDELIRQLKVLLAEHQALMAATTTQQVYTSKLETAHRTLERDLTACGVARDGAQRQITQVYQSTSWRLTRPIRWIRRLMIRKNYQA